VVVEPDEDKWHARVPELESRGAATWSNSRDEAFRNIQEVTRMVVEDMLEDGEPIPEGVMVRDEALVSVTYEADRLHTGPLWPSRQLAQQLLSGPAQPGTERWRSVPKGVLG
jgi:predicted RNase H-like HicB family nuclease